MAKLDEDDEVALEGDLSVDGLMKASSTGALLLLADDTLRGSSLDHDLLGSAPLGNDRLGRLLDRDLLDKLLGRDLLGDSLLAALLGRHPPGNDLLEEPLGITCLDSDLLAGLLGGSLPGNDLLDEPLGGRSLGNNLLGEFSDDDLLGSNLLDELLGCCPPDTDLLAELLGANLLGGPLPDELLGDDSLNELPGDTLPGRPLPDDLHGDPSGEAANPGITLLDKFLDMEPPERELLGGLPGDNEVPILESDSCPPAADLAEDLALLTEPPGALLDEVPSLVEGLLLGDDLAGEALAGEDTSSPPAAANTLSSSLTLGAEGARGVEARARAIGRGSEA